MLATGAHHGWHTELGRPIVSTGPDGVLRSMATWMAMSGIRSAAEWLEMADHARAVADGMRNPVARRQMLDIAAGYEALAGYAEFLGAARRLMAPNDHRDSSDLGDLGPGAADLESIRISGVTDASSGQITVDPSRVSRHPRDPDALLYTAIQPVAAIMAPDTKAW